MLRLAVLAAVLGCCGCGSESSKPAPPPAITNFALKSKLMSEQLNEVLVTPAGGGKGRPLLVFLQAERSAGHPGGRRQGEAAARLPARVRRGPDRHGRPGV